MVVCAAWCSIVVDVGLLNRRRVTPTEGSEGGIPPSWGDRSVAGARGGSVAAEGMHEGDISPSWGHRPSRLGCPRGGAPGKAGWLCTLRGRPPSGSGTFGWRDFECPPSPPSHQQQYNQEWSPILFLPNRMFKKVPFLPSQPWPAKTGLSAGKAAGTLARGAYTRVREYDKGPRRR